MPDPATFLLTHSCPTPITADVLPSPSSPVHVLPPLLVKCLLSHTHKLIFFLNHLWDIRLLSVVDNQLVPDQREPAHEDPGGDGHHIHFGLVLK